MVSQYIWRVSKIRIIFASLLFFSAIWANDILFEVARIQLGHVQVKVELAKSPQQQARGLMYRKSISSDSGMLFIYSSEEPLSFWMKNTFIPLSIGFFDKNRILVDVQEMEPVTSEAQLKIPTYQSKKPAMYALEMSAGWFSKNKIKIGDRFSFIQDKK